MAELASSASISLSPGPDWIWPLVVALLAFFASTLRRSLETFAPQEVLEANPSPDRQERLVAVMRRAKTLASGARWIEVCLQILALVLAFMVMASAPGPEPHEFTGTWILITTALTTVLCMVFWVIIPRALSEAQSNAITAACLPTFALVMRPFLILLRLTGEVQNGLARLFGMPADRKADGRILMDLRNALRDQGENDHLDETAQELIRNVLDFRAADAAEVMTPRTEVRAIDVEDGLQMALQAIVESGHSRIPVYEDTIDSIIGTVTARRAIKESTKPVEQRTGLRDLLDPPILVPETKPVAELLSEFRAVKQKLAVVLDEYGGTAGIATLSDVVGEIVGDFIEEHHQATERIRQVERDLFDVDASLHVSEVNEALHLTIPEEEDFETLGGFILAQLGHIPGSGESFEWSNTSYAVTEASDRRVMWVRVRRSA